MSATDLRMHADQRFSDEAMEARVLQALKQHQGTVTARDLVASTGLASSELDRIVRSMVMRYEATITVNQDGELVYRFAPELKALDDDAAMRRYRFKMALWRVFKIFYKVLIVAVLIGYVVAFIVLLFMVMAAGSRNNQSNNNRGGNQRSGGGGGGFWFWYFMMGNQRQARPVPSRYRPAQGEDGRPIWEKVFAFVFGDERDQEDPLVDRKRMLAWLVRQGGIVSPMELSERTGWSPQAAERESSKLLANYNGGVEIMNNGQTLFVFDELRDAVPVGTAALPAFYDRFEVKASNSGNTPGTDLGIAALNLFVLVISIFVAPSVIIPSLMHDYGVQNMELLTWTLVIIPALFSISFFAIPFFRSFGTKRETEARMHRNARRLVMKAIYKRARNNNAWFDEETLLDEAAALRPRQGADLLDDNLSDGLRRELRVLAHEWDAPQDVNDDGQRIYDFSIISEQLKAADHYRRNPAALNIHRLDEDFEYFDERLNETTEATQTISAIDTE